MSELRIPAPPPAQGRVADGFEPLARCFAGQLARGEQVGAAISVHHRGQHVVDLWGGLADVKRQRPWRRDTRVLLFSVTKGFVAMAMHLLVDRGRLDWGTRVADAWPGFGTSGKGAITVGALLNHRAGLPYLDTPLTLDECVSADRDGKVLRALESQRAAWPAGERQAYHAITFGMYARELFERVAGERLGDYLLREIFEPLGSDVRLGTPESEEVNTATLYAPPTAGRLARMAAIAVLAPDSPEARIARDVLRKRSVPRRAFANPAVGRRGVLAYDAPAVHRAPLAWASATGSADGVARAYLPFARRGRHGALTLLREETLEPVTTRLSWSERDEVLMKPVGWSHGFLKEERHLFSPHPESFGHAGMGGSLGWCDPRAELAFGYVMNDMDWRVRSPRALALCHTLYECEPVREAAPSRARFRRSAI